MTWINKTLLGKATQYESRYNKNLLHGVPREENRKLLGIKENNLPFKGEDLWNLYELSWLNPKGKPVIATAEVRCAINSINLIESKSFKLYLNSFNQTHFNCSEQVRKTIEQDLAEIAQGDVRVILYPLALNTICSFNALCIDDEDIEITAYTLDKTILENAVIEENKVSECLCSHLLKSNCLITGQPDWASVFIRYMGPEIQRNKLLQYLISFRQHNEFHEQCVERIFIDIKKYCFPEQLTVYARYTRRGGLDINPLRSDHEITAHNIRLLRQ
ncbi:MAG: NADPH-dependent 7-cyano-7-deazaguanine reductase QueF [Endozoicomonadaceae bacterium]|nr:NADPH-dependent 7-cyano-7-deazaguanine reductase QueF [Endozoicomonadaceae bacterium]